MIHYFITFYRTNNVFNQYSIALTILGSLFILYTMSNKNSKVTSFASVPICFFLTLVVVFVNNMNFKDNHLNAVNL